MKAVKLQVEPRTVSGTGASRRNRREGMIPAVIYTGGTDAQSVLVSNRDFLAIGSKVRSSQVFALESESKELNDRQVVVKDIQREYIKDQILHVDFQLLEEGKTVKIYIPLSFSGDPVGVKNEGGVLQVATRRIFVQCVPSAIPEALEVDLAELRLGERVRASDITLPDGVVLVGTPEETIASVVSSRVSALLEGEAKAAEGEGGEGAAEASAGEGEEKKDEGSSEEKK